MWYNILDTTFFRFVTNHAFDRRTDSFLVASPRWHSIQRGKKRTPKSSRQRLVPTAKNVSIKTQDSDRQCAVKSSYMPSETSGFEVDRGLC